MRPILLLALLLIPVPAAAQPMDGPVAGGAFGMSGSDYFGEIHDRAVLPARVKRQRAASAKHRPARAAAHRRHL